MEEFFDVYLQENDFEVVVDPKDLDIILDYTTEYTVVVGSQGEAGTQGPPGPAGPAGPQGAPGVDGAAGPTGPQGPAGATGPIGPVGPEGPEGPSGADGAVGPAGADGLPGDVGPTGPAGPIGATGATGPQGATGPAGATGATGAQGPQGPLGPQGPAGAGVLIKGTVANSGLLPSSGNTVGDAYTVTSFTPAHLFVCTALPNTWTDVGVFQGATGPAGPDGPIGPTGPAGAVGATGPAGATGPVGPAGPTGSTGSAGPQGPIGPAGAQGPAGPTGAAGPQGPVGPQGTVGPAGPTGATGPQGPAGTPSIFTSKVTKAEAETATDDAKGMTAIRTKDELQKWIPEFGTRALAQAFNPVTAPEYIRTAVYNDYVRGGGARYAKVASEPGHPGKVQIATGQWYALAEPVITPQMLGAVGDGVANDTVAVTQWFNCMTALGRKGFVPDGTYLIDAVDLNSLPSDLYIECQSNAVFKGTIGYQQTAGNGSTNVFTVTAFPNTLALNQGVNCMIVDAATGNRVCSLEKQFAGDASTGRHFFQSNAAGSGIGTSGNFGNTITLFALPPNPDTDPPIQPWPTLPLSSAYKLHMVASCALIRLRSVDNVNRYTNPWLDWYGGVIDCTQRGMVENEASGSGIGVSYFRGQIKAVDFLGGHRYDQTLATGIGGDSAFGVSQTPFFEVSGCYARGWGDAFSYSSGSISSGGGDNDRDNIHIHDNHVEACWVGIRNTRGYSNVFVHDNFIFQCGYGIMASMFSGFGSQFYHHVKNNVVICSQTFGIFCSGINAGLQVQGNIVFDIGQKPDGTVTLNERMLIQVQGCPGAIISGNTLGMREFLTVSSDRIGINIQKGKDADGVTDLFPRDTLVTNNVFQGGAASLDVGIREEGVAADFGGNRYEGNTMRTVNVPQTIVSTNTRWDYTIAGVYHEGVGLIETTELVGSKTWDPPIIAAGAFAPSTTVSVPGAKLGDFAVVSHSSSNGGVVWFGTVNAVDTVTCVAFNPTAGSLNPASGTLYARVYPKL